MSLRGHSSVQLGTCAARRRPWPGRLWAEGPYAGDRVGFRLEASRGEAPHRDRLKRPVGEQWSFCCRQEEAEVMKGLAVATWPSRVPLTEGSLEAVAWLRTLCAQEEG